MALVVMITKARYYSLVVLLQVVGGRIPFFKRDEMVLHGGLEIKFIVFEKRVVVK